MLHDQLENLRRYLEQSIPLKHVYIWDEQTEGGFCSFDDSVRNYAFIKRKKGKYKLRLSDQGCDIYTKSKDYWLIADIDSKIDAEHILEARLISAPSECGSIVLTGFDDDSRAIFKEHTEQEFKDCHNNLYCFEFTLTDTTECSCYDIPCLNLDV